MGKDLLLISVESRKGGVGKTTAALNLAKLLCNSYAVLFVDLDVTGTNTATVLDTSIWKEATHPVIYNDEVANLLELFQKHFLSGDTLPSFSMIKKNNVLFIEKGKINVLGSQIYNLKNGESKLTCSPSILFDELHAFWFVEFLSEIKNKFTKVMADKPCAIILDNSPGFVGFAPSIQDWLTDVGPVNGKFLFISSIDKQDIITSENAVDYLHYIYSSKYNASKVLTDKTENIINLDKEAQRFFLKLVENLSFDLNYGLKFYGKDYTEEERKTYEDNPEKYIGIIINKIPEEITFNEVKSNINKFINNKEKLSIYERILQSEGDKNPFMVNYENVIETQFWNNIHFDTGQQQDDKEQLAKYKELLRKINLKYNPNNIKNNLSFIYFRLFKIGEWDWIFSWYDYHKSLPQEISALLKDIGLRNYNILIDKEKYLENNLNVCYYHIAEINSLFRIGGETNIKDRSIQEKKLVDFSLKLRKEVLNKLLHFEKRIKRDRNSILINKLLFPLAFICYPHISSWENNKLINIYIELFSAIIFIEYRNISNARSMNDSLPIFLIKDDTSFLENEYCRLLDLESNYLKEIGLDRFKYFYNAVKRFQVRILDLDRDSKFLISTIYRVIKYKYNELGIIRQVSAIINGVIYQKSISHQAGEQKMRTLNIEVDCMNQFNGALSKILERWGIHWE